MRTFLKLAHFLQVIEIDLDNFLQIFGITCLFWDLIKYFSSIEIH